MSKRTLLDMTQNILSAMDSDEINSIGDTVESIQVAEVIKETYFDLVVELNLPEHKGMVLLDSLVDVDRPNYLRLPSDVKEIEWIKYDYQTDSLVDYRDVEYLSPYDFVSRVSRRRGQDSVVDVEDFAGGLLSIFTNINPKFWTTFDDEYIVFDSYNADQDTTLQQAKTLCWGSRIPAFQVENDFIPDLDANLFPLLLSDAKAVCFINFKQVSNAAEERRSRRGRVRALQHLWRANQRKPYNKTPNYGRVRPHMVSGRTAGH